MRNNPLDNLEFALLADDVPIDKVYPHGRRARLPLAGPDQAARHVGGRPAQPAQSWPRRVELATSWNGRIYAIQEQGARAGLEWNQGKLQWGSWVNPARQQEQGRGHEVHRLVDPAEARRPRS